MPSSTTLPGDRVVVKVVAASVHHKTEVGGVAVVPRDPAAIRAAMAAMRARLDESTEGFTVVARVLRRYLESRGRISVVWRM